VPADHVRDQAAADAARAVLPAPCRPPRLGTGPGISFRAASAAEAATVWAAAQPCVGLNPNARKPPCGPRTAESGRPDNLCERIVPI
jgi:hypothetical protein